MLQLECGHKCHLKCWLSLFGVDFHEDLLQSIPFNDEVPGRTVPVPGVDLDGQKPVCPLCVQEYKAEQGPSVKYDRVLEPLPRRCDEELMQAEKVKLMKNSNERLRKHNERVRKFQK